MVLKEKRDKKEKNTQTLTQMFPNTKKNMLIECDYDIPCYDQLPYIYVAGDKTTKKDDIKPLRILNIRKGKGWKLEFFVEWNNKCCEWIFVHGVINVLKEETEFYMSTYKLDFATCGYIMDPRIDPRFVGTKKTPRLYCDYEPLATTKFKPIPGATRDVINYESLAFDVHNKLKQNIFYVPKDASESVEILEISSTPTKISNESAHHITANEDNTDSNNDINCDDEANGIVTHIDNYLTEQYKAINSAENIDIKND
jgi:hypothetical protein